jgi:hypothetical protein
MSKPVKTRKTSENRDLKRTNKTEKTEKTDENKNQHLKWAAAQTYRPVSVH